MNKNPSIHSLFLVGHSNSGKSPLGNFLQEQPAGSKGRYVHFDFGSELRRVVNEQGYAGLSPDDRAYVRSVMNGRLIDGDHLSIAGMIITHFLSRNSFESNKDILVLNGFPRNIEQAEYTKKRGIDIQTVLYLKCPAETAFARKLASEIGTGFEDRSKRNDQSLEIFKRKIESFERETAPLIEYYRHRGIQVVTIDMQEGTSPQMVVAQIRGDEAILH